MSLPLFVFLLAGSVMTACTSDVSDPVANTDDAVAGTRTSAVVEGTVETETGQAVTGCLIVPVAEDGATEVPEMAVHSGPDGAFVWTLPAADYTFSATCDAAASPTMSAEHDGLTGVSEVVRAEVNGPARVRIVVR